MTTQSVNKQDIISGLHSLGLAAGHLIFLHSSLSAFGHVQGGAETVIDALLETVGSQGTVALPTFTSREFHVKTGIVFDLANKPSESGHITEVFRKRDDVIRSTHITHSVAAWGRLAQEVMGNGISAFGAGSSFDKLNQLDAQCLLLGVDFHSCTALHGLEENMQVPYRYYRDFKKSTILFPDGRRDSCRSNIFLLCDGYKNDFRKMNAVLAREGLLKTCQVGKATLTKTGFRQIADMAKFLEEDIIFLLDEISRQKWRETHGNS
jgi:aminoglycoside 3-N-acetyltransferase